MTHALAAIGLPFIPGWVELRPFVVDLWLIVTIVAILLAPFFTTRSNVACALDVLAGFRKTHRIGAEASLKYVLFGAATSAIMVYGLSYLYGLYGTLQIGAIGKAMAATGTLGVGGHALLAIGLLGLIVGIGFKISAV